MWELDNIIEVALEPIIININVESSGTSEFSDPTEVFGRKVFTLYKMYSIFSLPKGKPSNYFALHRNLFKILGISLSETESKSYRIYATVFLFCTIFTYPFVQCSEFFKFCDNLDVLSIVFAYSSVTLMGCAKACVLLYNKKDIGQNLDVLEQGFYAPNIKLKSQEAALIKNCIQLMNRQSCVYFGGVAATVLLGVIDAVYSRISYGDYKNWKFPVGHFSLFDVTHSPIFEIICVYQTVCVVVCFGIAATADTLIGSILAHIATQCKILQGRIKLMIENAHLRMLQDIPDGNCNAVTNTVDPSNIPWKYLHAILKETVINHIEVISIAEKFESLFSYLIMVQFLSTSASLCFGIYYCSLFSPAEYKFAEYFIAIIDMACQVLFYCYWGNEVFFQSLAIADAYHEVNYVGTDARFQKALCLMMVRSQRPITLTAGKFANLSLKTYVWIIRASYSYYMALINKN